MSNTEGLKTGSEICTLVNKPRCNEKHDDNALQMVECLAGDRTNGRVLGRGSHKWYNVWQKW